MTITQERLQELFHYCPGLGLFWHKPRTPLDTHSVRWNTKYAGKIAGSRNGQGYIILQIDGLKERAHRMAWLYMTGELPLDDLDHQNRNREDNAFDNLRPATATQNLGNTLGRGKSGWKGVSVLPSGRFGAWCRREYLGSFDTAEEASDCYFERAVQEFGEFARR